MARYEVTAYVLVTADSSEAARMKAERILHSIMFEDSSEWAVKIDNLKIARRIHNG